MRHLKRTAKLGRTGQHRNRMLASLVCSLIKHRRVKTTLAKAKAARSVAEKMITLGKGGTLHDRRLASARLHQDEDAIKILFNDIAPTQKERRGGYTRIVRLGQRQGDAALDAQGRHTLSPSLYERDAYQFHLRKNPKFRAGVRLAVQWKAKDVDWKNLKLRAEMRCLLEDNIRTVTMEEPAVKNGHFSSWAEFRVEGPDYVAFGQLVAWRVTLWEGDRQIGKLESFLWSPVPTK
jgi:large subunit ribosomal protein L17